MSEGSTRDTTTPSKSKLRPLNPSALAWTVEGRTPSPTPQVQHQPAALNANPYYPQGQASQNDIANMQELTAARGTVAVTPKPVLTAVLLSLLDDYPGLAPVIRYRCERGVAGLMSHTQNASGSGSGSPWPQGEAATVSPPLTRRRSGRSLRDDDQQELCTRHNNMRPIKHLQQCPNGHLECIPGFHCLVDSREGSAVPSNAITPIKDRGISGTIVAPVPLTTATSPPPAQDDGHSDLDIARLQTLLETVRLVHGEHS